MEKVYYVYQYVDPMTSLPFYIGKGKGNRMYVHLKETFEKTENRKKYAYIKGLRNKNLEPLIEKVCDNLTELEAYDLETTLIKKYGRIDIDPGGILTNICEENKPPRLTGKNHPNFGKSVISSHTEETKRKISESKKGKTSWHKGRKKSQEFCEKLSKAKVGTSLKDSTKQKLSELNKGENNPNYGTFWITNGIENKKVKSLDNIPDNWYKGRSVNHITGFKGAKDVRS
jgi:hypothetical protein